MKPLHLTRRTLIAVAAAVAVAPHAAARSPAITEALADLEMRAGGRLGVCFIHAASGAKAGYRMDERFALCSTFKLPLAAAILRAADQGKLNLDTVVPYNKADMIPHAPVTEANLAKGGMTIRALAEAAQKQSDNPAANLLLKQLGGPAALTQFFRDLGDAVTRIDRYEPEMNRVPPGDERDTTSPAAIAATVEKIVDSNKVLSRASRELLIDWMVDTATGAKRIRAGLPQGWRAGDKTGTGLDEHNGKLNDVAVAWEPGFRPLVIAAYYNTATPVDTIRDEDQAVLAEVGRIAAGWAPDALGTMR